MAKVNKNLVLSELSGKIGNVVVRKLGNKTVVQAAPVRLAPATAGELKNRQIFREAQAFAQRAKLDTVLWTAYLAEAKRRGGTSNAYAVAISDYRVAPVLHEIVLGNNASGLPELLIWASDNVAVARVEVKLFQEDGKPVSGGAAIWDMNINRWRYPLPAIIAGSGAEVTVFDLAGNNVSGRLSL